MIAIITFVTSIILATLPNNDEYNTTINTYSNAEAMEITAENISEWNYDNEKGWMFEMPEISIRYNTADQSAAITGNDINNKLQGIFELPEIEVKS